jgi:hypothetical protein
VARRHGLSAPRVSQLRRELLADWRRFCGEEPAPGAAADRLPALLAGK